MMAPAHGLKDPPVQDASPLHQPYPLESLFDRLLSPFERFVRRATAGGIVLVFTTIAALLVANSPWGDAYLHLWERPLRLDLAGIASIDKSLHHWVNDGLMALFFLLVGLELKREILVGELSSLRDAALPIVAAIGGMLVPAGLYLLFNADGAGLKGWGIPMATDIAFAIGILVLLAWRVPKNLILFLTALAIADDIGAVLVIVLFYTESFSFEALGAAAGILGLLLLINRGGVRHPLPYALLGILLWGAVLASGIHATIAGILLAFAIPARPALSPAQFEQRLERLRQAFATETRSAGAAQDPLGNHHLASLAEGMEHTARRFQSPLQRIEHGLSPWVTFLILPIFAFANAGIDFEGMDLQQSLASPVTQGILAGAVLGKFIGITLFSWIAVKLGVGRLPRDVNWLHLTGAAWLGGIGFTMALFINQLAFDDPALMLQARLGILLASLCSAVLGLAWLLLAARRG